MRLSIFITNVLFATMEDKLQKRVKIDWLKLIDSYNYQNDFYKFCKGKNIKSKQRLAYMFIKHIKGRNFVKCLRRIITKECAFDEIQKIAKTNWCSDYEL